MQDRICVVTGATSGIGYALAEALARKGATLALVGRDPARGRRVARLIERAAPDVAVTLFYADLSRLAEMKRVAREIAAAFPRIDVLVNCAGAMFSHRTETEDGLERSFALNHLSYFVLANLLLPNLRRAGSARIVNVASGAHRRLALDFSDLQAARSYRSYAVYGRSKLANILFTREMARRLAGTNVTVNAMHPGFVATRFAADNEGLVGLAVRVAMLFARSCAKGAETAIYLATASELALVSGGYFFDCRQIQPDRGGRDDAAARRLWDISAELAGLDGPP